MDYAQIQPHLYIGSHPASEEDIDELKNHCHVTAVLNLQTEDDLRFYGLDWSQWEAYYEARGIVARRVPLRDGDREDQRRRLPIAVSHLAALLDEGHTVYSHCSAGASRSPLVAMAYLHWIVGWPLEEAIRYVKERRQCSAYTEVLQPSKQDLLDDEGVREEIARRAYARYEQRRRTPGQDLEDWLAAEQEVLREILLRRRT